MKVRKSGPVIPACMGRRIMHSPPKKPAASPEKKLDAASAHSSAVMVASLSGDRLVVSLAAWRGGRVHRRVEKRGGARGRVAAQQPQRAGAAVGPSVSSLPMSRPASSPVLERRARNRALLERQLLLPRGGGGGA